MAQKPRVEYLYFMISGLLGISVAPPGTILPAERSGRSPAGSGRLSLFWASQRS
ncbi:MAG TPA: hypothetical protein V6C88_12095 [Chroococcidiopsis sp.]